MSMPQGQDIAPAPGFPERAPVSYERKMAPSIPGNRGPLRFEEGLGTDTDIPNDFQRGMMEGEQTPPGRPNHVSPNTLFKTAQETLQERAHPGSAAWVDSPPYLGEFADGAGEGNVIEYVQVTQPGTRHEILNAAVVQN